MEPDRVLAVFVAVWSAALLVRWLAGLRRGGAVGLGWAAKAALALVGVAFAWIAGSEAAVYGISIAWVALLLAPAVAAGAQARALAGAKPERALRLARLVRLLHPFDGWRQAPRLLEALLRARRGEQASLDEIRRIAMGDDLPASLRPFVYAEHARLSDDWPGYLVRVGDRPGPAEMEGLRLRALGETGRLRELVAAHGVAERVHGPDPFCDLMLLAFAGRTAGVEALLAGPFAELHPDARTFWRATARLVAAPGDAAARLAVRASAAGAAPPAPGAVARRLDGALAPAAALDAAARAVVDRAERRAAVEAEAAPVAFRRPFVTYGLVALNLAAFGLEIASGGWDGPTDLETLYRLGALWPPALSEGGEWWRLGSALFLHFGPIHLALNMLALLVFGRAVERVAGPLRMAALYAVSGVGSMAAVLALEVGRDLEPQLLVGASGAIFGIVGAVVARLGADALAGVRGARRPLIELAALVALQVAFDLLTPEVSFSAHAAGFGIGLVAGLALRPRRQRPT